MLFWGKDFFRHWVIPEIIHTPCIKKIEKIPSSHTSYRYFTSPKSSSWFKFTNILLPKSIHTSNTNSFLHHVNPFSNLYLHASPPFGHLKIFLLSPPWIAQIFHVHELWVFSGMTHYRILTFYKRQRYLLYNTPGKGST